MRTANLKLIILLVAGMLVALGGHASADYVRLSFLDPENTDTDVDITIDFHYIPSSADEATIKVELWNDSDNDDPPGEVGVSVTGFAFNAPESESGDGYLQLSSFSLTTDYPAHDFTGEVSYNDMKLLSGSPYGIYDIGAYNKNKLLGGNPQDGIREGESAIFEFVVERTQAAIDDNINLYLDYTAVDIVSLLSEPHGADTDYFIVRWQDYFDDESGKLLIDGPGEVVPEPLSMLLFGTAMATSVAVGLKKRKKQAE